MDDNATSARPAPPASRRRTERHDHTRPQPKAFGPPQSGDVSGCESEVKHDDLSPDEGSPSDADELDQHFSSIPSADFTREEDLDSETLQRVTAGSDRNDLCIALLRAKEAIDGRDATIASQEAEIMSLKAMQGDLEARLAESHNERLRLVDLVKESESRVEKMTVEQQGAEVELQSKSSNIDRLQHKLDEYRRKIDDAENRIAAIIQSTDKDRKHASDQHELVKAQNVRLLQENQNHIEELAHLRDTLESIFQQDRDQSVVRAESKRNQESPDGDAGSLPTHSNHDNTTPPTFGPIAAPTARRSLTPTVYSSSQNLRQDLQLDHSGATAKSGTDVEQSHEAPASQGNVLVELQTSLALERTRVRELEQEKTDLENMLTAETFNRLIHGEYGSQGPRHSGYQSSPGIARESSRLARSRGSSEDERADDDVPDVSSQSFSPDMKGARWRRMSSVDQSVSMGIMPTHDALGDELAAQEEKQSSAAEQEAARLRLENKNLSTYVTKILNRILSMEGFERVLAADAGTPAADSSVSNVRRSSPVQRLPFNINSADTSQLADASTSQQCSTPPPEQHSQASFEWRGLRLPSWATSTPAKSSSMQSAPNGDSSNMSSMQADSDEDDIERRQARMMLEQQGHAVPENQLQAKADLTGLRHPSRHSEPARDSVPGARNNQTLGAQEGNALASDSIAGDESYVCQIDDSAEDSSTQSKGDKRESENEAEPAEPAWRKMFKRISLIGSELPEGARQTHAPPPE